MPILLLIAFIARLIFVPVAHHGDLNNNASWGKIAMNDGIINYYDHTPPGGWPYSVPNQPPLYILVYLSAMATANTIERTVNYLNNNVGIFPSSIVWWWQSWGNEYLIKLPSILADLGIGYLIYQYFKRHKKIKTGILISLFWLINPVSWYNSAVWGQTDAIVNFLGLWAVLLLLDKKLIKFTIMFTLAFLFKSSLLIFVPVLLLVALNQKHSLKKWLLSGTASIVSFFLIAFPFHPSFDFIPWIVNLYQGRILSGEIGDLTANAFNFWWLIDPGKTLDSKVYYFLTAHVWGYLISAVGIGLILVWLRKKFTNERVFIALSLSALVTFLFLTRMHERYMFPFFPYATLALGSFPLTAPIYIMLSITHLLNLYHLFWAPSIKPLENLYRNDALMNFLSLLNLALFALLLLIFYNTSLLGKTKKNTPPRPF